MSNQNWLYAKDGQQYGPCTPAQLRILAAQGTLAPVDYVWTEGLAEWIQASRLVPIFFGAPSQYPPVGAIPNVPEGDFQVQPQYAQPDPNAYAQGQSNPLQYPGPMLDYRTAPSRYGAKIYAGFWLRFVAAILDGLVLGVFNVLIELAIVGTSSFSGATRKQDAALSAISSLVQIIVGWLYFALQESSAAQATPGKRALGIKVTDSRGNRVSFGRATGRHFGQFLSAIILGIGYIMAGFTQKKQALHDIMADCLVVRK